MKKLTLALTCLCTSISANAIGVSGQGTWETTLLGRDLDGDLATAEAYYDTVVGITWLADANYAYTSGYLTLNDGMKWVNANAWAAALNPYGSNITGWRLPITNPIDGTTADDATFSNIGTEDRGYNVSAPGTLYAGSTASEMAHMFYVTLGNTGWFNTSGVVMGCIAPDCMSNTGPFSNVQSGNYWSATEYALSPSSAWHFNTIGYQYDRLKYSYSYAWAVHAGDVGVDCGVGCEYVIPAPPVPIPAAAWLFGSGLLGLIGVARKKTR